MLNVLKAPRVKLLLGMCSLGDHGFSLAALIGSCGGGVSTTYEIQACQSGSMWALCFGISLATTLGVVGRCVRIIVVLGVVDPSCADWLLAGVS